MASGSAAETAYLNEDLLESIEHVLLMELVPVELQPFDKLLD